ncbi:MAG: ADP-ribose pyrophosphatase [Acidithiobacillales bacterium SM23_46]|jgi:ADP-ribose pyrophosphatase YjhB (NUDIX family)|nr:MAG: ADP-ribose pyrophosphatase [Acidithiobacillales bacterium SM23_46]KPL28347.1 MAG: ADP-ribose pyrophosphatase [Acidithiobacillales bacterium SM1_46]
MNFCSHCGTPVELRIPEGDHLPRYVCPTCGTIHYQNPKVVVGSIPQWEDRILLCKRAIEPRHGLWTLPAGFMENEETTIEGALRETMEEAGARVEVIDLHTMFNLPHVNQVYVMFRANLLDLDFGPGPESLEVALYDEKDIPWNEIAFPVIEQTMRLFFEDRRRGTFGIHTGDIIRHLLPNNERRYETRMLKRR